MKPPPATSARTTDEFPPGANLWPPQLDRREFLQRMGAGLALATLSGCFRPPREEIRPYVRRPEMLAEEGAWLEFASSFAWRGYGRGIVVRSHQGRPVKIEGNPDHPASLGATDAVMQAAVLDLYDPGRTEAPRRDGQVASWNALWGELLPRLRELGERAGNGLWLLLPPSSSPTLRAACAQFRATYPEARLVVLPPVAGLRYLAPETDFANPDRILGVGADFLTDHPESLPFARAFATRRRGWEDPERLHRFYQLEAAPSVTGEMADSLLRTAPSRWPLVQAAILHALEGGRPGAGSEGLQANEKKWVRTLADDLRDFDGRLVVAPGSTAPASAWAFAAEVAKLRGAPQAEPIGAPSADLSTASLKDFAAALENGEVETALLAGVNPAHHQNTLTDWGEALGQAAWSGHFATVADETSAHCRWHAPLHHFLEDWSDLASARGTVSLVQPLIRPRFASRSLLSVLTAINEPGARHLPYDLVRASWKSHYTGDDFEGAWRESLQRGVAFDSFAFKSPRFGATEAAEDAPQATTDDGLEVEFRLDPCVGDGSAARNAWLQELPKPISHQVWGSALWMAPETAAARGLRRGQRVRLSLDGRPVALPVLPVPGVAPGVAVAFLGAGRPSAALYAGQPLDEDAGRLRTGNDFFLTDVRVEAGEGETPIVTTQHHYSMEGHDFVRLRRPDKEPHEDEETPPSFLKTPLGESPQWGMSIDLSSCNGCGACITACQAENNIPVVGPDQVALGREMHWIRIDRYHHHDDAGELRHLPQPVPCMHCEKAPCEVVCPVEATVHDAQGTNAMIYNRCIGTRYCSNNCPYKVRRFNFLDYRRPGDDPRQLQHNPAVTIRERGVMEKCTYCVQRTERAMHTAGRGPPGTPLPPVQTACAQACPTEAIVFGDLCDPASELVRRKEAPGDYDLLGELDTRPRTTYLPRWHNPPS